ncbi:MAG: zinc-ribbon domain-containing protein [Deltaproteobacteria bacterium]|nr:zinc-ribbon domain-containing protein [Deltaproteobacteria bacterium]
MEVICNHCNAKLSVPDDKIPKGQMFKISCPKCKEKITIELPNEEIDEQTSSENDFSQTGKLHLKFIESKRETKDQEKSYSYDDFSGDESLEFIEGDAKLALILTDDPDKTEKIKAITEQLGYRCIPSKNTRDALGKLRFHNFSLIFLSEGFDGQELSNSPIINYLNHISMSSRRKIFVALMSDRFKTADSIMSYAMSANLVINPKDMEKIFSVLKAGISEWEKFYKVFMDTLVEVGKA